ncbi:hypothetical protein [Aquiflexum sp.]|uniref:hypothetical protein n=1 Tax=Aquiflexum sp. TaxID=1872584 RepID=UPI003594185B
MKSTYSIIYSPVSAVSEERINLGLLMIDDQGTGMLKYSHEKLNMIKNFFSEDGFKLLKSILNTLEKNFNHEQNELLTRKEIKSDLIHYFAYYTNNLISFSSPKEIGLELDENNFAQLFTKWVFKSEVHKQKQIIYPSIKKAKENFIPKVQNRVNIDYKLNADEFDFMVFNMQIDMIGKNDRPVLTQFFDFQANPTSLKNKINEYVSIIKPLELKEMKVGKFFMVGQEPDKDYQNQHVIWNHLQDSPLIKNKILEIIPPSELELIESYFEEHEVRHFVEPD